MKSVPNSYYYTVPSFSNLVVGGYAGLVLRIQGNDQYDALAIRTANGLLNNPVPVSALTNFCAQLSAPQSITFNTLMGNSTYSASTFLNWWWPFELSRISYNVTWSIFSRSSFDFLYFYVQRIKIMFTSSMSIIMFKNMLSQECDRSCITE